MTTFEGIGFILAIVLGFMQLFYFVQWKYDFNLEPNKSPNSYRFKGGSTYLTWKQYCDFSAINPDRFKYYKSDDWEENWNLVYDNTVIIPNDLDTSWGRLKEKYNIVESNEKSWIHIKFNYWDWLKFIARQQMVRNDAKHKARMIENANINQRNKIATENMLLAVQYDIDKIRKESEKEMNQAADNMKQVQDRLRMEGVV